MGTRKNAEQEGQERRGKERSSRKHNISNSSHREGQRCWQKTKMLKGEGLMASFATGREGKDDDDDVTCNYWQYLYQRLLCNC